MKLRFVSLFFVSLFLSVSFYAAEPALVVAQAAEEEQKGAAVQEAAACPICLDNKIEGFINRSAALTLACGHTMCLSCAPGTIQANARCPKCRTPIAPAIVNLLTRGAAGAQLAAPRLAAAEVHREGQERVHLESHKNSVRFALLFALHFMGQNYLGRYEHFIARHTSIKKVIFLVSLIAEACWLLRHSEERPGYLDVRKLAVNTVHLLLANILIGGPERMPANARFISLVFGSIFIGNELFDNQGAVIPFVTHRERIVRFIERMRELTRSIRAAFAR
jgi:hypothetical protein